MGPDGVGAYLLMFEKFGGFCKYSTQSSKLALTSGLAAGLDVGYAQLIRDGKVKVKQDVEPQATLRTPLSSPMVSSLPADMIYATSYRSIRDDLRRLFTDAVIDQTAPLWGIDEEGELRGCYRSSGSPGIDHSLVCGREFCDIEVLFETAGAQD
ncbi:hypothetical protein B0H14DRAFT_2571277 [Mycena olivaceomarginata]|nr:hypothetical protein B0H14DRAFT_2571277 [Mycena olivaceomarginata]